MPTSHWFLITLSQVDQVPEARVELVHHILETGEIRAIFQIFVTVEDLHIIPKHVWGADSSQINDLKANHQLIINQHLDHRSLLPRVTLHRGPSPVRQREWSKGDTLSIGQNKICKKINYHKSRDKSKILV